MNKKSCDILIVGGGIVGTSIARKLGIKYPHKKIILMEKEAKLGTHNSILNSGVLHAGLYYPTNSLRKKYCIRGNQLLTEYHKEKRIPLRDCGKLIAAKNIDEVASLTNLYNQGIENGVELKLIDMREALKIEPNLKINGDFPIIFSPNTKVGNPSRVIQELERDTHSIANVEVMYKSKPEKLIKADNKEIVISTRDDKEKIECGYFINAAGIYADKIAKLFNVGAQYDLIPIIGTYLVDKLSGDCDGHNLVETNENRRDKSNKIFLNSLIYPVPPIKGNNFLGVHTTITTDGSIKIGPTALPCFWREQHNGFSRINFKEIIEILSVYLKLLNSDNRYFIMTMINKQLQYLLRHNLIHEGKSLVSIYDSLRTNLLNYKNYERFEFKIGGIRTQIFNTKSKKIENDFIIERRENHMHLLNIISPGWTSALAIAEDINI